MAFRRRRGAKRVSCCIQSRRVTNDSVAIGEQAGEASEPDRRPAQMAQQEAAKPKYYTVKRGDALSSIAARWNTTADTLRAWNNISGNKIRIGQTLLVKPQANETVVAGEVGATKK